MTKVQFLLKSDHWPVIDSLRLFIQEQKTDRFQWTINTNKDEENTINFQVLPLNWLEVNKKTFRIVSVLKRSNPEDRLLTPPEFVKKNMPEILRTLPLVSSEKRICAQAGALLEGVTPPLLKTEAEIRTDYLKANTHAVLFPWWVPVGDFLDEGWKSTTLHPSEFTPDAGSGCWAIVDDGNSPGEILKEVKKLHHPASVVLTNTERKVKRDFVRKDLDLLGVFLQHSTQDKYELYLCLRRKKSGEVQYVDYPTSTLSEMVPEALKMIDQHLE
nr:hypothetical protein [Saprospiraceae bacterium]